ncbi:hypothetical protein ACFPRL_15135 [Pseudoclavibacter helvolus]
MKPLCLRISPAPHLASARRRPTRTSTTASWGLRLRRDGPLALSRLATGQASTSRSTGTGRLSSAPGTRSRSTRDAGPPVTGRCSECSSQCSPTCSWSSTPRTCLASTASSRSRCGC